VHSHIHYQIVLPMKNRKSKHNKSNLRREWYDKFIVVIRQVHRRNLGNIVNRVLKRVDSTKYQMVSRSKKAGVECLVTVEQLRQMLLAKYGTPCKYCNRVLVVKNFTFDHIVPLSKGGASNIENLQVICKTCNHMKGSLIIEHFELLLDWLKTVPYELSRDIKIRLSRGIH
jgi:5-methylcytosine-specific restriction endonuclease McrA